MNLHTSSSKSTSLKRFNKGFANFIEKMVSFIDDACKEEKHLDKVLQLSFATHSYKGKGYGNFFTAFYLQGIDQTSMLLIEIMFIRRISSSNFRCSSLLLHHSYLAIQ